MNNIKEETRLIIIDDIIPMSSTSEIDLMISPGSNFRNQAHDPVDNIE